MDCIQCGERKGFRKATATARMARPRPPHAGGPAGPVCLWARPMPRTPHHPRARRHPPPKDDCTRRPVAPAAILSIALSAPSLPSCRAARRMPRVCAACSHTLNRASWYQDGARFNVWQRLWHSYIPNGDVPRAAWQAPLTSPSIAWPPRRPSVHMFSFVHDSVWHLVASGERLVDNALSLAQAMAYFYLAISRFFCEAAFCCGFYAPPERVRGTSPPPM